MPTKTIQLSPIGGDELHNQNCYEFLLTVFNVIKKFKHNKALFFKFGKLEAYDPDYPYGDLYTAFLTTLEKNIDQIPENEDKTALLNALFLNQSNLLERTAEMVVSPVLKKSDEFTFSSFESTVTKHLNRHQKKKNNSHTPQGVGSIVGRAWSSIGEFCPMKTTSIPCVKKYDYKMDDNSLTEIRMGTQAECIWEGETGDTIVLQTRINPLFKAWIKTQKKEDGEITHVYFNLLGRDRTGYEGNREKALTTELESLESAHPNIAIITLPADQGFMHKAAHQHHAKDRRSNRMFAKMLNIATGTQKEGVRDFYISENIKTKLYSPRNSEAAELKALLTKSFKTILNIDDPENCTKKLSPAQLQAVYFHFIKYELTNFILTTLKPTSFNTSCKDGIDRGGVASLYYNLMKSIELGNPLTEVEFQRGLHAAPTMVKGRGINHHGKLIWNAVHHYIEINQKNSPNWLIKWRDDFAPDNSQVLYIKQLTQYVENREKKSDFHHPFFSTTHAKTIKIGAANKVKTFIENPDINPQFTTAELKALQNGNLNKLFQKMGNHGIDFSPIYLQQLEQYRESRKKNASTFHSFFGCITGFSKGVKLSTVDKLILFLKTKKPQSMYNIEWNALHDGKLGDIVKAMKKNGVDFSTVRKERNATPAPSMRPR